MKCVSDDTKHAVVDGVTIHIDEYDKKKKAYCPKGHLLCGHQGEHNIWHFKHMNSEDVSKYDGMKCDKIKKNLIIEIEKSIDTKVFQWMKQNKPYSM